MQHDPFGPGGTRMPPQFRPEDIDFSRLLRIGRILLLALVILAVLAALNWGRVFYTDYLWFSGLGHEAVLFKRVLTQLWLYLLAAGVFVLLAAPNLYAANRAIAKLPRPSQHWLPKETFWAARKLLLWTAIVVVGLTALAMGVIPAENWESFLRFFHGVAFDAADPIFDKDISFYIFTLPVVNLIRYWLLGALVITLLLVGGLYYLDGLLRGESFPSGKSAKTHLLIMAALIFVLIAAGHWLSRYDLLFSRMGAVYGIGYTEHHLILPALIFLTAVALISAGLLIAAIRTGRQTNSPLGGNRLIIIAIGGWLVLSLLATVVIPQAFQRLRVEPSELGRERPYLAHNINLTRRAYGLADLKSQSHPAKREISAATISENQGTIQNIRLWDEGPLLQSYNQIQFFRLYYDFLEVQTDRYRVADELRQVMISTRELSSEKLPSEAQRWVNRYLQFTHGYGVAMSPVTEVTSGGRPRFFIKDVPPKGKIPLERPEIYYGLKSLPFAIVRSDMKEFNYPGPEGPVYTHYGGHGGVPLNSFFRRLLYAWRFGDINILISGEINPESRIQYRRTIEERFQTITPFLMRDQEAYTVTADGKLYFIQDAYTVSNRFPYSTPWAKRFNYMRNSVKAVVDTYNGDIDYYVFDPEDPLVQTYRQIFPGLFKNADQMPDSLRRHVRYPMDLFSVQSQMLLQYHMKDPVVFYNKEDQWSLPVHKAFGSSKHMKPYYIVARLPGEENEEFILLQPFTPNNRHNLVGWMAARSDGERYGEKILYHFPSGRHVDGPNQVEARIDNDAIISEQFTLWGQVGSEVFRGNLLVIPIGDALLYAEPVFLKPETLNFPELRRIILADTRQVVMHPTLDKSVDALVGELPAVAPAEETQAERFREKPGGVRPDDLKILEQSLEQAIRNLKDASDQLKRMRK